MTDILTLLATGVLAQTGPQQTGPDFGKASPFGLIVVVLLLIGVFGLVWSMNRHLRRLPTSFDQDDNAGGAAAPEPYGGDSDHTNGTESGPNAGP